MLTADTNVWARALLNDDAVQTRKARTALAEARTADGVYVPLVVFTELAWVLQGRWNKDRVLKSLEGLLRSRGIVVESPALARKAVEATRKSSADLVDHLIAEVSFSAGVREIITFDKAFGRCSHVRRLI